jgi:hypothetical protein
MKRQDTHYDSNVFQIPQEEIHIYEIAKFRGDGAQGPLHDGRTTRGRR